jgi:hypothetical protein
MNSFVKRFQICLSLVMTMGTTFTLHSPSPTLAATAPPSLLLAQSNGKAPQITEQMIQKYIDFLSYATEIQFSPAQRAQIRTFVQGYMRNGDQKSISEVKGSLTTYDKLLAQSAEEREVVRKQARPIILTQLQQEAIAGKEDAKWLLNAYYQAHPPIASGNPPLTRDMVDAHIEMEHFLLTQVLGHEAPPINAQTRAKVYQTAAAQYAQLSPQEQRSFAEKPGQLALTKYQWARMSAEDRLMMRAQIGGVNSLSPQEQMMISQFQQQANQMLRSHNWNMMQSTLNNMRQNTDIIMGTPPIWNPSTNRYEQRGGIITEFK